ncbi:hypothetical protein [Lentzea guizhouensis]|nr:hypothetical protein [Lentzea guizhouensis]
MPEEPKKSTASKSMTPTGGGVVVEHGVGLGEQSLVGGHVYLASHRDDRDLVLDHNVSGHLLHGTLG